MTDNTEELDIAQRIAEALSRKSEPRPTGGGSVKEGGGVIGSVPTHLRHLHNLVDELGDEANAAARAFHAKRRHFDAVRSIFFESLEMQVPEPENASSVTILENWDVAANISSNEDGGESVGLGELLAAVLMNSRRG